MVHESIAARRLWTAWRWACVAIGGSRAGGILLQSEASSGGPERTTKDALTPQRSRREGPQAKQTRSGEWEAKT
jgi:hypothetical protein